MNISKIIHVLPHPLRRHKIVKMLLSLSPGSRIQLVTFNGSARLFADISDSFTRTYLFAEGFEPEFFSIAKLFLSKGGVFFDVGANVGFCSFGLMGCLDQRDVEYHLFEANVNIYQLLLQSAKLYPDRNIRISHCCVTDRSGASKLLVNPDNLGSSFISDRGTQDVENLVLDNYIRDHSIERISLLKIDIEGCEPLALKGAMKSLSAGIVDAIYMEVSTPNLSRAGFCPEDCFALLGNMGFYMFYVKPIDFELGIADRNKAFALNINGYPLVVAKLDNFPDNHQTDILAIHKSSGFLKPL